MSNVESPNCLLVPSTVADAKPTTAAPSPSLGKPSYLSETIELDADGRKWYYRDIGWTFQYRVAIPFEAVEAVAPNPSKKRKLWDSFIETLGRTIPQVVDVTYSTWASALFGRVQHLFPQAQENKNG